MGEKTNKKTLKLLADGEIKVKDVTFYDGVTSEL